MHHGPLGFFVELLEPVFPVYSQIFGFFFNFVDPRIASFLSVLLVSITVSLIISLLYLVLVDREEYNRIRERQKEIQEKVKEAQDNDEMEKANKLMKESFSMQKKFMKASVKPMIASMFIFFLIVPWILTTFSPVIELEAAGNGTFQGEFTARGFDQPIGQVELISENDTNTVLVDGEEVEIGEYVSHDESNEWILKDMEVEDDSARVMFSYRFIPLPFNLPLIGSTFEWLGTFILFQLPFSILFRKMLGIH